MVGIYLSGTGNTKFCVETLLKELDPTAVAIAIEEKQAVQAITKNDFIILGYPVQFSNAPIMVRDFIKQHADLWQGKKVICLATMGLFSGDGAGCGARLLKKCGATVVGGLHLNMPDSICDEKALKRSKEKNRAIIQKAEEKIIKAAQGIKNGNYPKDGLYFYDHLAGLFGQRLWFYNKTTHYTNKLKISDACVGCGLCASRCPMENLVMKDQKPVQQGKCTMCYRCVSSCPKSAITLLGKKVHQKCRFENY